jgi:hypothetical protein
VLACFWSAFTTWQAAYQRVARSEPWSRVGGHRQRSAQPGCGNNQNPNLSQKPSASGVLLRCRMTYAIRRHQRHGLGRPPYRLNVWRRPQSGHFMTEITRFVALAFDLIDGALAAGEAVDCASPAVAIQTAQGQWKFLGHTGAVAFSRTSDFERGIFDHRHVLRRFGQVPDEYRRENDDQ